MKCCFSLRNVIEHPNVNCTKFHIVIVATNGAGQKRTVKLDSTAFVEKYKLQPE